MTVVLLASSLVVTESTVLILRVFLRGPVMNLFENEVLCQEVGMDCSSHICIVYFGLLHVSRNAKLKCKENGGLDGINIKLVIPFLQQGNGLSDL